MENLKPFRASDLFKGKDKIVLRGGFDPWTLNGSTKLKTGSKIDVPLSVYNVPVPMMAVFDILRIENKKAADMSAEEVTGNIPHPAEVARLNQPVQKDDDIVIVHIDPASIQIHNIPLPKKRLQSDGIYAPSLI